MVELLDRVPDEFYNWVKSTVAKLNSEYNIIESECLSKFESVKDIQLRKEIADTINNFNHKDIIFRMLDGKEYKQSIWRKLKPEYKKPFKETNE
jgi:RNA ligase